MQLYGRSTFIPPVVKNLIILNVIFFIAKILLKDLDLDNLLGLHYPSSKYFKPFQFITYMFMHDGIMHIFFNMYGLFMFGPILENALGSKKFLFYYIFTGIGAALLHFGISYFNIAPIEQALANFIANPSVAELNNIIDQHIPNNAMLMANNVPINAKSYLTSIANEWTSNINTPSEYIRETSEVLNIILAGITDIPLVGASGAIFGILLAFAVFYPMVDLYLFFIPVPIKAKWAVIGYGLIELYMGIANSAGDNVAHFAHLGGMLFGLILIFYWKKTSNKVW